MKSRVVFAFFIAAACSGTKKQPADTTSAPPPPASNPVSSAVKNPCEHTGLWAECSLERRLKQSGFVVKKLEEKTDRHGFTIDPVVYSLGSSKLEAFFYKDEKSANRDVATVDTAQVTLIRSANLVAVLTSQNPRQAERVMLAITAGPPQPGSPR